MTVDSLTRYVSRHPGDTLNNAIIHISHHYNSNPVAVRNLKKWIDGGIIKTVQLINNKLYIKKDESIDN